MLDICLCGTGGMMPLKNRHLASAIFRLNGKCILIDCGEGTQTALKEAGFTFKPVDVICFTHFHADHISGLPGFLLTMGNEGREEPLRIIGPAGVERVVNSLRIIAPGLPFEIEFTELREAVAKISISGFEITAFRVSHNVPCYGYRLDVKRAGKFDVERARRLPVPVNMWGKLQRGETVEFEGKTYYPSDVLGEERPGISVVYSTDTRPCKSLTENAAGCDMLICEGMFGEEEKLDRAKETGHMLMQEAAAIAKKSDAGKLVFTHYSPSVQNPGEYICEIRKIFSGAYAGYDGYFETLKFKD